MRTCLLKGNSKTCIFVNFHKLIVDLYTLHHSRSDTELVRSNSMSVDLSEEISQDAESSRDSVKSGSELSSTSKEAINGDVRKVIIINMCILILK